MTDKPVGLSMRTRLRPGIYWDDQGYQRECAILELVGFNGAVSRLSVVDVRTRETVPDPDAVMLLEVETP